MFHRFHNTLTLKTIHTKQHRFLRARSTVSNLHEFQEFIMSAFGDSFQVDSISLGLSKAWDKVNHSLLVAKLPGYRVRDRFFVGLSTSWGI